MKSLLALFMLIGGAVLWRLCDGLSSDAVAMALGVLFGILALLPVCILLMASVGNRQREIDRRASQFDQWSWDQSQRQRPSLNLTVNRYTAELPYQQAVNQPTGRYWIERTDREGDVIDGNKPLTGWPGSFEME